MSLKQQRRSAAPALLIAALAVLVSTASPAAGTALGAGGARYVREEPVCAPPAPDEATCFAVAQVAARASEAAQPDVRPLAAASATGDGPAEGFTPAQLAHAYGFDSAKGGEGQTVAVVDAYKDPSIEADLAEFSAFYGLSACTKANGCLHVVGQTGSASALPEDDTRGWSVETSLDVEMVHATCQKCHILLVEASSPRMTDLASATKQAAELGAQEISNSYGGNERGAPGPLESAAYNRPGVVIAAATGDDGWGGWEEEPSPGVPQIPASMPSVVSVGGTTLELDAEDKRESEQVWNRFGSGASGGGCSILFASPLWQRYVPGFSATGCGDKRLSADVAADADPATGFDIFDSYNCGPECEEFKVPGSDWSKIGGTSLATPLVSAMYALAGGAQGIAYPALTLYAHLGDAAALFDVIEGGNGFCDAGGVACGANAAFGETVDCEGTTSCNAVPGFDGPSGVGAPSSLAAFVPVAGEEEAARRRAEEVVAAEAQRKAAEEAAQREAEEAATRAAEAAAHKPSSGQGGTAGFKASVVPAATLRGTRLQAGRGGAVTVRVACPVGVSACAGTVSVRTLGAVIAGSGARASVLTLATGRFKVAGGHVVGVRLRLTRRGAALLARRGKLRVRVLIAAHDAAGASHSSHAAATLYAFRHR